MFDDVIKQKIIKCFRMGPFTNYRGKRGTINCCKAM